MANSMEEMVQVLQDVKFKHRLFGGVDEADLWKKIGMLQEHYEALVEAERQKAQGTVEEYRKILSTVSAQLQAQGIPLNGLLDNETVMNAGASNGKN